MKFNYVTTYAYEISHSFDKDKLFNFMLCTNNLPLRVVIPMLRPAHPLQQRPQLSRPRFPYSYSGLGLRCSLLFRPGLAADGYDLRYNAHLGGLLYSS